MAGYIGTYKEKTLHRELKKIFEPNNALHETPVGKYIADIKTNDEIIEIQTQSLYKLNKKLTTLLLDHRVVLVYPIARQKLLVWTDGADGEILRTRKSPRKGSFYDAFKELYQIKTLLDNKNLRIRLVLIDVTEQRVKDETQRRYKKNYTKIDTHIRSVNEMMELGGKLDYLKLIPDNLKERFTSGDYATSTGLSKTNAGIALNILRRVGAITFVGKDGRYYLYERSFG